MILFTVESASAQGPVWSPKPFKPASSSTDNNQSNPLRNSLRSESTPVESANAPTVNQTYNGAGTATESTTSSVTQRWRKAETASRKLAESRSYANTPNDSKRENEVVKASSETTDFAEDRNAFSIKTVQPVNDLRFKAAPVQLASYQESNDQSSNSISAPSSQWRDLNSTIQSMPPLPSGSPSHAPTQAEPISGKVKLRPMPAINTRAEIVRQEPSGALSLPPTTLTPDLQLSNGGSQLQTQSPTKDSKKSEPNSETLPRGNRSLLDDEPVRPNPFPRQKDSPSDQDSPVINRGVLDDDRPPTPPKRERVLQDCDAIRDFALKADIRNIRVDSSPNFVEGFGKDDNRDAGSKDKFLSKSPDRTWYSTAGEPVAKGKLVDLVYGAAIIESSSGDRVSFLVQRLSDSDQVFIAESWGIPVTCPQGDEPFLGRNFVDTTVTWKASGACHKPLYFEEVQLERYGHEWGPVVQPAISTVKFFGNLAVLPYKMGIHPMNECQYPLGYYRPGSCAPWSIGPVPISLRGALSQAKFVTAAAWALP